MILKFDGILEIDNGEVTIGGVDVFLAIRKAQFEGPVTVAFAGATFTGDLYAWEETPSYSELTPGDPPELTVGNHQVWPLLEAREDEVVTLWIADEPINTLDPPPVR